ncbi:hypothetical protein, partial [Burkholderia vietnamiensis]|uniref:hypothetical protein n=1 Tax=Burkholderia vietnamiensis TaxID=60552 RepID=UPI003FF02788
MHADSFPADWLRAHRPRDSFPLRPEPSPVVTSMKRFSPTNAAARACLRALQYEPRPLHRAAARDWPETDAFLQHFHRLRCRTTAYAQRAMLAPQRSAPSGTCLAVMPVPLDTATDGNDESRERRKTTSKYRGIGSSRRIAAVRVGRRLRRIGDMNGLQVRSVKQQACLRDVVPGRPAAGGAWRCTQRVGALRGSGRTRAESGFFTTETLHSARSRRGPLPFARIVSEPIAGSHGPCRPCRAACDAVSARLRG